MRSPSSMLIGKGATPIVSSRSLKSSTTGMPSAAIASMEACWNGVRSWWPTRWTRSLRQADWNKGSSSSVDHPALPAAAQPS
jgi:hypothetical protein